MWERRDGIQAIDIKKMSLVITLWNLFCVCVCVIQYVQQIVLVGHYFKIVKESPLAWEGCHLLEI